MNRMNYALMSLTAAVPSAVLVVILVLGFLQHADKMPGLLPAVAGLALLIAAGVAVMPVGILLFGGGGGKPATKKAAEPVGATAKKAAESKVATEDTSGPDFDAAEEDWNEGDSAADFDEAGFGDSEADEFELDDSPSGEVDAEFDFDDDERR